MPLIKTLNELSNRRAQVHHTKSTSNNKSTTLCDHAGNRQLPLDDVDPTTHHTPQARLTLPFPPANIRSDSVIATAINAYFM